MAKLSNAQIKTLMDEACEVKKQGGSLSKLFEDFALKTGRAKGSIRNVYYSSLKKSFSDEKYKNAILGKKQLSVAKIISFEDSEADFLLEKILTGVTFGKSVRRVISEMTSSPKLALRYQNKYRNILKFERQRVEAAREKITKTYGKCCNPYKDGEQDDVILAKLKREINGLCDRVALEQKKENERLKQRISELENQNKELQEMVCKTSEQKLKEYFDRQLKESI